MSQQYFYQHEDTGRVCCIASPEPPSHRWYSITEEQFRQHESQLTPVAADAATPDHEHVYYPIKAGGPLRCVVCNAPRR